jgi:SAM-dependent methyltransferase
MTSVDKPNGMNGAVWRGRMGEAWANIAELMERSNRPVGDAVAERTRPRPSERVLDIGCGAGATTLDMARRLGPDGLCVGADISPTLIAAATAAAGAQGISQARFIEADAETYPFEAGQFDAVISRFGVMFFDDPDAAFANIRRSLTPDGRLVFACWRSPADNPLATIPVEAARPFVELPPPPPKDAPGRFAFADPDRVRGILERSGWRDIEIAPFDAATPVSVEEMVVQTLKLGPLGGALAEASDAVRAQVMQAVTDSLAPHVSDGVVDLHVACWLVSARP